MKKITLSLTLLGAVLWGYAQEIPEAKELDPKERWYHADLATDSIYGVADDVAYKIAERDGKKPNRIIVAVIDSGVDAEHEDLASMMWVNSDEIPGNNIDDDKNGYIDDIHGWNFIGNANGKNLNDDTLEITRLVKKYSGLFDSPDEFTNETNREKMPSEYEAYKAMKTELDAKLAEAQTSLQMIDAQMQGAVMAFTEFGNEYGMDKEITVEGLRNFETTLPYASALKGQFEMAINSDQASEIFGRTPAGMLEEIQEQIDSNEAHNYYEGQVKYNYNVDFDPRPEFVGDNYEDNTERFYGNNDVEGPDALHGTHVAGIIGAERDNGIGMDGIAKSVKIMSVRTVPNGDERDKDVANAIRYAVDNGAKIINMSFGKAYSPNKDLVWDAIKYATDKDVLLVHAAGNDNKDIDSKSNFPTNFNEKGELVSDSFLTVGASTRYNDKIKASFSNIGKTQVDIFAPGLEIYSTIPDNKYKFLQGTSMAAPVVSGVAALVWSYYPELTAKDMRDILIESGNVNEQLADISTDGVIVDAVKALQLAEKRSKNMPIKKASKKKSIMGSKRK